jgi:hypothetical protein
VGPFGLCDGALNDNMIDLSVIVSLLPPVSKSVLEPLVMVRIVSWVGKVSACCGGS